MASMTDYYDFLKGKVEAAKKRLDEFDARQDEFSPENFLRRRQPYVEKLEKAQKALGTYMGHLMELAKEYNVLEEASENSEGDTLLSADLADENSESSIEEQPQD